MPALQIPAMKYGPPLTVFQAYGRRQCAPMTKPDKHA